MKKCDKCGTSLRENTVFCPKCGEKITNIEENTNHKPNYIFTLVVIVICILIFLLFLPSILQYNSKSDSNEKEMNTVNKNEKIEVTEQKETNGDNTIKYTIEYHNLGDYGKMVEYEGNQEYFYYFPSGTYELKLKTKSSWKVNACWLFIDYNNAIPSEFGSEYETKEKFLFVDIGETKTITLTDDVHIWLGEGCTTYELTKKD